MERLTLTSKQPSASLQPHPSPQPVLTSPEQDRITQESGQRIYIQRPRSLLALLPKRWAGEQKEYGAKNLWITGMKRERRETHTVGPTTREDKTPAAQKSERMATSLLQMPGQVKVQRGNLRVTTLSRLKEESRRYPGHWRKPGG